MYMFSVCLLFCDRAICNIATNRGELTLPDFNSKHVNLLFRKYYSFNKIYQTIARVSQNDFCKDSIILKRFNYSKLPQGIKSLGQVGQCGFDIVDINI